MRFLLAADDLKSIERTCHIANGSRWENSAEHSWHVCLFALTLAEHSPEAIDVGHVLKLLVIHDLVEVYAGDTHLYDDEAVQTQADRETTAAEKLFGILSERQRAEFLGLWREFELRETAESRFARAVDALAPAWLHWGDHAPSAPSDYSVGQVRERKLPLLSDYPALMAVLEHTLASATLRGILSAEPSSENRG